MVPDKMEGVFRLAVAAWCARAQRTKAPISESSSEKAPKNKTSLRETDPETPPQETGKLGMLRMAYHAPLLLHVS